MINSLKIFPLIMFPDCFLLSGSLLYFPVSVLSCQSLLPCGIFLLWSFHCSAGFHFCNHFLNIFNCVCLCVWGYAHVLTGACRGHRWSFKVGVTGSCDLPDVSGGNHTWGLWNSSMPLTVEPSLQPLTVFLLCSVLSFLHGFPVLPWLAFPLASTSHVQVCVTIPGQLLTTVDFYLFLEVYLLSQFSQFLPLSVGGYLLC